MKARLPNREEWISLQGGAPIILQSRTGKMTEIIHAYHRQADDEEIYSGPLAIVPTPTHKLVGSLVLHFELNGADVAVPAALLWDFHGRPCRDRSGVRSDNYEQLQPHTVDAYIQQREAEGWRRFDLL